MNEELIKQCAREVCPGVEQPGSGEQNYRYAAAVMAIETYHARAVAPLEQENAELRALVAELTERAKADGERIGRLEASVAPLVEAATKVCARWSFYDDTTLMADLRAALAPFQQEALAALLAPAAPEPSEAEVDRVAARIMGDVDPDWAADEYHAAPKQVQEHYRDCARAALAAMKGEG